MNKRIHVVINPASGQPDNILNTINRVFHPAGIDWDISITKSSGDAVRFAQEAVAAGADVVAAYGGDGTVMEVAQGVMGSQVPLAILPGGTANLMSVELGIPKKLVDAAQIASSDTSTIRQVDMGQVGERTFILRVEIGFGAEEIIQADRELKDKYGRLAYVIAKVRASKTTQVAHYQITVDRRQYEVDGFACFVDNSGTVGVPGVSMAPGTNASDGYFDVLVVRDKGLKSLYSMAASMADKPTFREAYQHWQARSISIKADPPQPVQADGELLGETPISIGVLPGAMRVLVPSV